MKKLFCTLILTLTLFSCSSEDDASASEACQDQVLGLGVNTTDDTYSVTHGTDAEHQIVVIITEVTYQYYLNLSFSSQGEPICWEGVDPLNTENQL